MADARAIRSTASWVHTTGQRRPGTRFLGLRVRQIDGERRQRFSVASAWREARNDGGGIDARGTHARAAEFWTFKVIHAVIGGLLTVAGACGGIFVTEQIRKQIGDVNSQIGERARRPSIRSNARSTSSRYCRRKACCSARSATGDGMREEFRRSFLRPRFPDPQRTDRADDPGAQRDRSRRIPSCARGAREDGEAALPADDKAAWDNALKFEMETRASCAACTENSSTSVSIPPRPSAAASSIVARDRDRMGLHPAASSAS